MPETGPSPQNADLQRYRAVLEKNFRDPVVEQLLSERTRSVLSEFEASRATPFLIQQFNTLDAILENKTHALFAPITTFLLWAFAPETRQSFFEPYGGREFIEIGMPYCIGIVPSVFKCEHGFVVLIPYGFFLLLEAFQGEVEQLAGKDLYLSGATDQWPENQVEAAVERFSTLLLRLIEGDSRKAVTVAPSPIPDITRRNKILQFVVAHELTHALRDHFGDDLLPFGSRMLERSADAFGFAMCLRAEDTLASVVRSDLRLLQTSEWLTATEKELLRRALQGGPKEYDGYIERLITEYVIATKAFFALVYILEKTIGRSSLARNRLRTHPSPTNRAFWLSFASRGVAKHFGVRTIGPVQHFLLGRAFWRFAKLLDSARGAELRSAVRSFDVGTWTVRSEKVKAAFSVFS